MQSSSLQCPQPQPRDVIRVWCQRSVGATSEFFRPKLSGNNFSVQRSGRMAVNESGIESKMNQGEKRCSQERRLQTRHQMEKVRASEGRCAHASMAGSSIVVEVEGTSQEARTLT